MNLGDWFRRFATGEDQVELGSELERRLSSSRRTRIAA